MTIQWLGYSDGQAHRELTEYMKDRKGISLKWFSKEDALRQTLPDSERNILFICPGSSYDLYELSRDLSLQYPLLCIILVIPKLNIDYKKAMYSGAVDLIEHSFLSSEIEESIRKADDILYKKLQLLETDETKQDKDGKIIAVCSTKGGVGKTTLAVNLATAIAKGNAKVAIIDLDLQFGDVAIIFDAHPKKTFYDWIKECYENENGRIEQYMTPHTTGVDILAAPFLPEFAELITGEHVQYVIGELKRRYDVVLIDTPPSFVETVIITLENAEEILLVSSLDLPTLKNGKVAIETLQLLNLKDKVKVVLNRDAEIEGMKLETVESILGMSVYSRIPSDYKVVISSLNRGIPFVNANPRSLVARSVFELANKILEKDGKKNTALAKQEQKRSIFKLIRKHS